MVRMTRAAAGKVEILAGIEHTTLTTLAAGGGGVVGGGSNLFPDLLADLVCAYRAGDLDEARRLQWIVLEANERLKALGGKLAIKRLLRELGLDRIAVNNRGPTKQQPATGAATWRESAAWFERTCGVRRAQSSR
jgi:dihydrodipicolinate synthase/N-acetylneuraminate lyase